MKRRVKTKIKILQNKLNKIPEVKIHDEFVLNILNKLELQIDLIIFDIQNYLKNNPDSRF